MSQMFLMIFYVGLFLVRTYMFTLFFIGGCAGGKIVSNGPVRQTLWDLATTVLEGSGGNTEIILSQMSVDAGWPCL